MKLAEAFTKKTYRRRDTSIRSYAIGVVQGGELSRLMYDFENNPMIFSDPTDAKMTAEDLLQDELDPGETFRIVPVSIDVIE